MKLVGQIIGIPVYEEETVPEGLFYMLNSDDLEVEGSKDQ